MSLTPREIIRITEVANIIHSFLPSNSPVADPTISFSGVSTRLGLTQYWQGSTKRIAVLQLLKNTFEFSPDKFCPLILSIVTEAIIYRGCKSKPIKRWEILNINQSLLGIKVRISDLWDEEFLNGLDGDDEKLVVQEQMHKRGIDEFRQACEEMKSLEPQERGYKFQGCLYKLFEHHGLKPRTAFRNKGEEIDGSIEYKDHTYLVEAKWQASKTASSDLSSFSAKVHKSKWARGIFISYNGYSGDGLEAFSKRGETDIIGIDGEDLALILNHACTLERAIDLKLREASETGRFFVPLAGLLNKAPAGGL